MLSRRFSFISFAAGIASLVLLGGCPTSPTDGAGNANTNTNSGDTTNEPSGQIEEKTRHEKVFTEIIPEGFQATSDCLKCHADEGMALLDSGHFNWGDVTDAIAGLEGQVVGKINLINNFCIAVPSNEGRCTQCHPSFGWKNNTDPSFFENIDNIDCLVCHDTTGLYQKHPSANGGGGPPALKIDGEVTVVSPADLQDIVYNVGKPTRRNCGFCHFNAGGGDNVKHGDMGSSLADATREMDYHMGELDFSCQTCHQMSDHGISGNMTHNIDEGGASPRCERCHGETDVHSSNPGLDSALNFHLDRVACETCHLPAFSRTQATKVAWYWDEAGQNIDPIPLDEFGKPTYDKLKGRFVWGMNVRPAYHWDNGKWERKVINLNDTYTEEGTEDDPIILAAPTATAADADAKVYPFKRMIGRQAVDPVNKRLVIPHLFGSGPGLTNAYWSKFDWGLALADGAAYVGQEYSGTYGFANTAMYYRVSHEIPPASSALLCGDCHGHADFWDQLGMDDPFPDN